MDLLKREREIELCGEQQRWFDLIRWHRNGKIFDFAEILNGEKSEQGESANFTEKESPFPDPPARKGRK